MAVAVEGEPVEIGFSECARMSECWISHGFDCSEDKLSLEGSTPGVEQNINADEHVRLIRFLRNLASGLQRLMWIGL